MFRQRNKHQNIIEWAHQVGGARCNRWTWRFVDEKCWAKKYLWKLWKDTKWNWVGSFDTPQTDADGYFFILGGQTQMTMLGYFLCIWHTGKLVGFAGLPPLQRSLTLGNSTYKARSSSRGRKPRHLERYLQNWFKVFAVPPMLSFFWLNLYQDPIDYALSCRGPSP